jgi:hypothetical protein
MHAFNKIVLAALSLFAAPVKSALAGAAIKTTTPASRVVHHAWQGSA